MRLSHSLWLLACLGPTLATGCASGGKNWWHGSDQEGSWGVELVVDGSALPVFEHAGRSWVEGRWGERYTIRVHNRTAAYLVAVHRVAEACKLRGWV